MSAVETLRRKRTRTLIKMYMSVIRQRRRRRYVPLWEQLIASTAYSIVQGRKPRRTKESCQ